MTTAPALKVNVPVLLGGLLVTLVLVAMLASGFGHDPRAVPKALEGRVAPAFELKSTDGETISLA